MSSDSENYSSPPRASRSSDADQSSEVINVEVDEKKSSSDDSPRKYDGSQRMPAHSSFVVPLTEPPTFRMSDNCTPSPSKSNAVATPSTKRSPELQSSSSEESGGGGTGRAVKPASIPMSGNPGPSPVKKERWRRSATSGADRNEKAVVNSYPVSSSQVPTVVGAIASNEPPMNKSDGGSAKLRLADAEDTTGGTDLSTSGVDGVAFSSRNQSGTSTGPVGSYAVSSRADRASLKAAQFYQSTAGGSQLKMPGAVRVNGINQTPTVDSTASPSKPENLHLATGQAAVTAYASVEEVASPKISSNSTTDEKADRSTMKTSQFNQSSAQVSQLRMAGAVSVDGIEDGTNVNSKASPSRSENLHLATGQAAVNAYDDPNEEDLSTDLPTLSSIVSSDSRPGARMSFSRPRAYRAHSPVRDTSSQNQPNGDPQPGLSTGTNRPAEVADAAEVAWHFDEAEIRAMASIREQSNVALNKSSSSSSNRRRCIFVIVVLAIAAIVATVVALTVGGDDEESAPLPSPTDAVPTAIPTMEPSEVLVLDPIKVEATELYIVDQISSSVDVDATGSPQNLAWLWLVSEDQMVSFSNNMSLDAVQKMRARYILAVFYYSLGGSEWTNSRNWLDTTVDECEWEFVTCDQVNEILYIATTTSVGGSFVEGSNKMTGGLPTELKHLGVLERLQLPGNEVTGFPLLNDRLKVLDLAGNSLLTGFENIYSLTNLESLDMESTGWEGMWNEGMSQLSNLVFLDVAQNMLSGTMSLQSMPKLQFLTISNNRFEGTLDELLTCDQCPDGLVTFVSVENPLTGPLPLLTNFTALESFLVTKSLISGTIPTEYGLLSGLTRLDLSHNVYMSGPLPAELGGLSNLEYFNIGSSSVSGTVPSEFGQLQSLQELFLSAPFLSGTIPEAVCAIGSLVGISYSDNLECPCAGTLCIPALS